jgi:hypothetical protein
MFLLITSIVENWKRLSCMLVLVHFLGCALLLFNTYRALGQTQRPKLTDGHTKPALVIGFVGGFVHSNDLRHAEVQLGQHLRATCGNGVQVQVFRNRERAKAHKAIVQWLNGIGTRTSTGGQRPEPRIILFGHSWGASAVVYLARELERDGVPVTLTIQVDSVRKNGEDDSIIPDNVAEAVNFYQIKGVIHGRSKIVAADPTRTKVLGNFRFQYEKEPAECHAYPWYDRLFFKGHTSIECDPRVWSQVETLIETRVAPNLHPGQTALSAQLVN